MVLRFPPSPHATGDTTEDAKEAADDWREAAEDWPEAAEAAEAADAAEAAEAAEAADDWREEAGDACAIAFSIAVPATCMTNCSNSSFLLSNNSLLRSIAKGVYASANSSTSVRNAPGRYIMTRRMKSSILLLHVLIQASEWRSSSAHS